MTIKMRKCGNCGERAVVPVVLESYKTTLEHDGHSYELELLDFPVKQCSKCDAIITGEEAEEQLSNALRAAVDVLTPTQIRDYRKGLNLTQVELANHLRLSPSTISRWESGAQIQQRSMDVLLRLFFEVPECRIARKYPEPQKPWQPAQFSMTADGKIGVSSSQWEPSTTPLKPSWKNIGVKSSPKFAHLIGTNRPDQTSVANPLKIAG